MRGLTAAVLLLGGSLLAPRSGPPYSPPDALKTFRLADDFQIELFAAEPLISDPVAMEVDEYGRTYVVEMHGYPLDLGGSGRVIVLDDTDADGKPDRRTVFAEGLRLPTGIMRWKNGVLVTDSPEVWYFEDRDGDGRADMKRVMLTGFALSNPQHTTNTPLYGLDNWIYIANEGPVRTIRYEELFGDRGRAVHFPDRPEAPRLPADAAGRNVRVRPDTHELEMLSSRSQFGQTFDAWGRHFLITNNRHIYHEVIAARYLARNPALTVSTVVEQVPDYPMPAELFPITRNPKFELLTDIGVMTAASGLTYYLADLFPAAYRHAAFVAEGAHNVVHVASVREHGVTFRASRMHDGREFLASTDPWFRPVNFYVGPDGALYLLDYYRKILEHPEWLDDATAASRELYAGKDRGRIYRIAPRGAAPASWMGRIGLGRASSDELVRRLADPNIWWRRHAQRLLVDRKAPDAFAPLSRLASAGDSPVGRVHALWTLEGTGQLEAQVIERALRDQAAAVRENAIKLAEGRVQTHATSLLAMENDPDPKVRLQLLLTLGDLETEAANAVRNRLLVHDIDDEWIQIAALSAARVDPGELFGTARATLTGRETAGRRALFHRIGAIVGADGQLGHTRDILRHIAREDGPSSSWWRAATLEGLASGVRADEPGTRELDPEREILTHMALAADDARVRRGALHLLERIGSPRDGWTDGLLQRASHIAADPAAGPDRRADAVRLLALSGAGRHESLLRGVLSRAEPAPVQIAAVRALGEADGDRIASTFIDLWERWTPAVREEAVKSLVREPGRIRVLLDAVATGTVGATEIERPLRIRLMMVADPELRARARSLFGGSPTAEKDAVSRYRAAAAMAGEPARGRQVFARACSTCHQYRGSGGSAYGPDLGEVRNRDPLALLTDILHPNHSIADGYELWIVQLADGSSTGGIIRAETPTSVTFRLPGGGEATVSRDRIASMRVADVSAMPEGLDAQIDRQEMADLVAFIKGG